MSTKGNTLSMTIEVELGDAFTFLHEEEFTWFQNEVLVGNGTLVLHSDEIGDIIGIIKKVSNVRYIS